MGSIDLIAFAILVWFALPRYPTWAVLAGSAITWFAVSITIWKICDRL
jgi:hypothetical protein